MERGTGIDWGVRVPVVGESVGGQRPGAKKKVVDIGGCEVVSTRGGADDIAEEG